MQNSSITQLFLRFYARCFIYPYEEMGYELQHVFRQMEKADINEDDALHLDQILSIINQYQGEEIKDLRENYVILFGRWEGNTPLCPQLAGDFMQLHGKHYDSMVFEDMLLDSDIPVDPEDPLDSIVNYLEYLSVLYEDFADAEQISKFLDAHIFAWIPLFCDVLYRASQISFYKELASGLKSYLTHNTQNIIP